MKGLGKALARTPHLVTSKVGITKKSTDPEFADQQRQFASLEDATQKLLKDCGAFTAAVISLLESGQNFSTTFYNLFQPLAGEFDVLGKYPDSAETAHNVTQYQSTMEDLRGTLSPELELIESRIVGPSKELQVIMKQIRKAITKRERKLVDYDRHNNSLTKLRDKKEKSLNDEKALFKLEQDFEVASNEFDAINNAMKVDLPRFMTLATQFIDPLFHSFYYMQLNIFYLMVEKLQGFASGKYETGGNGSDVSATYESKRSDAGEQIEGLNLTKRVGSTVKIMQSRQASTGTTSLGRSATVSSTNSAVAPSMKSTPTSNFAKKTPPPPPSMSVSGSAPPPPYSSGGNPASSLASKKAPPAPPPLKPKPKSAPALNIVVALYDFAAQAEGDLEFRAGDQIEIVERSASSEDWWTGKLNGKQGVFPGNYVQDV